MSGPIKEKDGRVRHFKGVDETVSQDASLGNNIHFANLIPDISKSIRLHNQSRFAYMISFQLRNSVNPTFDGIADQRRI